MKRSNTITEAGNLLGRYSRKRYRVYALSMLMIAYVFNFVDRQILAILQEPIKLELGLSDTQLGLLTGFAFAIFYVSVGLPIARLADRGTRRNIIAISVGFWSIFTALCGLAVNYFQLLAARIGVGVGEAGCSPPAHSMISDIFPPGERATALGTYNVGISIGILIGFLSGGWLNEFFGWRVAFFAVGIPGVVLALALRLTLAEPARGLHDHTSSTSINNTAPPTTLEVLRHLWEQRTFRHMAGATGLFGLVGFGLINWLPSFFIRSHELSTGTIGTWMALILGVGGGIGSISIGYLSDRLGRRDARWYLWAPALVIGAAIPFSIGIFLVQNSQVALLFFVLPGAVLTTYAAPFVAVIHGLVENRMRALSSAIFFLVLNLLGLGLGPVLVGSISDFLTPHAGTESLRYALLILIPLGACWGVMHSLLAARTIRTEMSGAK